MQILACSSLYGSNSWSPPNEVRVDKLSMHVGCCVGADSFTLSNTHWSFFLRCMLQVHTTIITDVTAECISCLATHAQFVSLQVFAHTKISYTWDCP